LRYGKKTFSSGPTFKEVTSVRKIVPEEESCNIWESQSKEISNKKKCFGKSLDAAEIYHITSIIRLSVYIST